MPVTYQDVRIADAIGAVLTGGDTFAAQKLTEDDMYHLERENFMSLVHTPETRHRIATLVANNGWTVLDAPSSVPLWTDDFSNILSVLSLR